jgi:hypothetical protein
MPVVAVANNNGSVIGVLCRYRTFGFSSSSAGPAIAPLIDPVPRRMIAAIAHDVTAVLTIEMAIADAPLRYSESICTGSMLSRCGSGSHTAPTCCQPGVRLSMMRRATTRWARAS